MRTANLQDRRVAYAFRAVNTWPKERRKAAVQRVQGLPVELRNHGLVVTTATLMKDGHANLAEIIARWLLEDAPLRPLARWTKAPTGNITRRLLGACVDANRTSYLAAQSEALALTEHIKRFAVALASEDDPR